MSVLAKADSALEFLASIGPSSTTSQYNAREFLTNYDNMNSSKSKRTATTLKETTQLSVQKGRLHVKAIFPDHTAEYVDIDPKRTTVGMLKDMCISKHKKYNKDSNLFAIAYEGKHVQEDWLAVDCGIHTDGIVHIVHAKSPSNNISLSSLSLSLSSSHINNYSSNDNIPPSTIMRAYSNNITTTSSNTQTCMETSLSSSDNTMSHRVQEWETRVRPEEKEFHGILMELEGTANKAEKLDLILLVEYQRICQDRLVTLLESSDDLNSRDAEKIQKLRSERDTWRLLYELRQRTLEYEADEKENDHLNVDVPCYTEYDVLIKLGKRDSDLRTQKVVLKWLESIASEKVHYSDKTKSMRSRTAKVLMGNSMQNSRMVHHIDPDATMREMRTLQKDDQDDELLLLQGLWGFLRCGQVSEAEELCTQNGHPWRAASIAGGQACAISTPDDPSSSSELFRWGNPNRALWKTMCWNIAEKNPENRDAMAVYERTIYASLCGHVSVLIESPICTTWEDHCWAYCKAAVERKEDEALLAFSQNLLTKSTQRCGPRTDAVMERHLKRTEKHFESNVACIFENLLSSNNETVSQNANSMYRLIQAQLICENTDAIIDGILGDRFILNVQNFEDDFDNEVLWDMKLDLKITSADMDPVELRFAAHLVLFFDASGDSYDSTRAYMILKSYIRHLTLHRQVELIPLFVDQLPTDGCINVFAQVLRYFADHPIERKLCMEVASEHFATLLPTITKLAATTVISHQLDMHGGHSDTTLFKAVELLCLVPSDRAEALIQSNALIRYFVSSHQLPLVQHMIEEILPPDTLAVIEHITQTEASLDLIDSAVREHLMWNAYLIARLHYMKWREASSTIQGTFDTMSSTALQNAFEKIDYRVSESCEAMMGVLNYEGGWMCHVEECCSSIIRTSSSTVEYSNEHLRSLVLPQILCDFHRVFYDSATLLLEFPSSLPMAKSTAITFLKRSLQLMETATNDECHVFSALSPSDAKQQMTLSSQSVHLLLRLENQLNI